MRCARKGRGVPGQWSYSAARSRPGRMIEYFSRSTLAYWARRGIESMRTPGFAHDGPKAMLINGYSSSGGDALPYFFRERGLGSLIGTRTWGGEIWLSSSNNLVDNGIATAAEYGVYGPEGKWLIEGHGVDPDIVVDNYPHETFLGKDRQLETAISHLQDLILKEPVEVPGKPKHPDKSIKGNSRSR